MMEAEPRSHMTEKILNLTLEIIYLLTGENCPPLKSGDHVTITVPLKPQRPDMEKILEVAKKMTELLTGEVPIRCRDVTVYLSMEEWEYLEGHKDLYKDVMMEEEPDGSRKRNPPQRCPRPQEDLPIPRHDQSANLKEEIKEEEDEDGVMEESSSYRNPPLEDLPIPRHDQSRGLGGYKVHVKEEYKEEDEEYGGAMRETTESPERCPEDSTQEDLPIPHHDQGEDPMKVKVEDDVEETYVRSMEEAGMTRTSIEEDAPTHISTGHTMEDHLCLSWGCKMEDEDVTADCAGKDATDSAMDEGLYSVERAWSPSDSEQPHPLRDGARLQGNNTFSSPECGKGFLPNSKLLTHFRPHTGEKLLECGNRFSPKLNRHLKVHPGEKPYACYKYGKCFPRKDDVVRHNETHAEEKPYCCPECGRGFSEKTTLNTHLKLHVGEKQYACSKCGKWFAWKAELFRHQRTHAVETLCSCSECGKSFSQRAKLNRHRRVHLVEKPYACYKCQKLFAQKSDLLRHQRIHTERKRNSCPECGKSFLWKADLFRHQRSHTGKKSYYCPECGKRFPELSHLHMHQISHTEVKPDSSSECGKCSSPKSDLSEDEKCHTWEMLFSCPQCGKCSNLCTCQGSQTEKSPYSCSDCGGVFSQSSQNSVEKSHAGKKPYSCTKCGKCFSWNSNLSKAQLCRPGGETTSKPRGSGRISAVWTYFTVNDDNPRIGKCKLCSANISRGGSKVSDFNTTNLIKHLKLKHPSEHAQFVAVSVRNAQRPAPAKHEKWSKNDPRSASISQAITQFILLDDQPLSILGKVGFRRLLNVLEPKYEIPSQHYITGFLVPQMHNAVNKRITDALQQDIKAISFTAGVSPASVIGITAQWIDDSFTQRHVMLHVQKCPGSPTGQGLVLAGILQETIDGWAIPKSSVHVVLREDARDLIKGADDAGLPSIPCVAHTLQLAVSEGLLSQRSIAQAVGVGRRIVAHFKHSNLEYSRLRDIQIRLGQPVKTLLEDAEACWESTFYMLRSVTEQKRAIVSYAREHELPLAVTANVWNLMEKTLNILAPFEELARQLSSSDASASDVIPAVTVLQKMLSKQVDEERGTKSMKSALLAAFRKRFLDTERNPIYCIATLLDPRYKDRFFSHADTGRQAKEMLLLELEKISDEGTTKVLQEAAIKPPDGEHPGTSLESVYEEIAQESTCEIRAPSDATIQLEVYLGEATVPRSDKALRYWASHKLLYPALARLAQKYLSAPCSRWCSAESHLTHDGRDRLLEEQAEVLLFLKKNLLLTFQK